MKWVTLFMLALLMMTALTALAYGTAQALQFTQEYLVLEAGEDMADGDLPQPLLIGLDTATLLPEEFFREDHVSRGESLRPLQWSPLGNFLAVAIVNKDWLPTTSDPQWWLRIDVCVLTRAGRRLRCMTDPIAPHFYTQQGNAGFSVVSWSQDERRLFYVTAQPSAPNILSLVEAEVSTGRTLRTVFINRDRTSPQMTWTSDLTTVFTGVGDPRPTQVIAHNLPQGTTLDISSAIAESIVWACPVLSPRHDYMSLVVEDQMGSTKLLIVAKSGVVVREVLGGSLYPDLRVQCPTWTTDESMLYFNGYTAIDETADIFRVDTQTGDMSIAYRFEGEDRRERAILSALQLSPSGGRIAFTTAANPTPEGGYAVKVIGFDGSFAVVLSPYYFTAYPLWVPPIQLPPTPTPQPLIYRAIQNGHQVHIERALSAGIDTFDSPPRGDGWTLVGRTHGSGTDGTLMAFVVLDDVPYAAIQHATKGCIVVTPESLAPIQHAGTRKLEIVEAGVAARCAGDWSGFAP